MSYCLSWLISTSFSQLYLFVELKPLICCNEQLGLVIDINFTLTAILVCRKFKSLLWCNEQLGLMLQVIYAAWAGLDWTLKHNQGTALPLNTIRARVRLLHKLLSSRSAHLDMTQACALGVPILMDLLAGSLTYNTDLDELATAVLDILADAPDMVLDPGDDRLWKTLQRLLLSATRKPCLLQVLQ